MTLASRAIVAMFRSRKSGYVKTVPRALASHLGHGRWSHSDAASYILYG
jgi:hypothetical protein